MEQWAIFMAGAALTVIGTLMLRVFAQAEGALDRLGKSCEDLNVKIAVVIERLDTHERRIQTLEERA